MRKIKRWLRNILAERAIEPRRMQIMAELRGHFKNARRLTLTSAGSAGHDSIYFVEEEDNKVGVLRLLNPAKNRPLPKPDMPFILPPGPVRIDREFDAYTQGATQQITPMPLWRTTDALLCAYLPYEPLNKRLRAEPEQAWQLICQAVPVIHKLHQSGLTHMDVSLSNILVSHNRKNLVIVDFEYVPAAGITPAQQRVYDHLRLIESSWKFIPEDLKGRYQKWLDILEPLLDDEMQNINLSPLAPALGRVLADKNLGPALKQLFS